jgi:hypothetical protein
MKNKPIVLSLIILLTLSSLSCIAAFTPVSAAVGQGSWITRYTISDYNTGQVIIDRDFQSNTISGTGSIIDGATIKVAVTIKISVNNPSTSLTLSTALTKGSLDHIWEKTNSYNIGSNYNPSSQSFTFPENAGTLTLNCIGKASGKVAQTYGDVTLHKAVPITVIALKDPNGAILDAVQPKITDAKIDQYNNLLKQSQSTYKSLQSQGVDGSFLTMYNGVIQQSQAAADAGLADTAISMLKSLNVAAPPTQLMQMLFLPLVAVFAVIAILFAFLFFRNRGKASYIKMMVEDQIKDLEGLSMRAQRIDRNLAANLANIKQRLEDSVGADEDQEYDEGYDSRGYGGGYRY